MILHDLLVYAVDIIILVLVAVVGIAICSRGCE